MHHHRLFFAPWGHRMEAKDYLSTTVHEALQLTSAPRFHHVIFLFTGRPRLTPNGSMTHFWVPNSILAWTALLTPAAHQLWERRKKNRCMEVWYGALWLAGNMFRVCPPPAAQRELQHTCYRRENKRIRNCMVSWYYKKGHRIMSYSAIPNPLILWINTFFRAIMTSAS